VSYHGGHRGNDGEHRTAAAETALRTQPADGQQGNQAEACMDDDDADSETKSMADGEDHYNLLLASSLDAAWIKSISVLKPIRYLKGRAQAQNSATQIFSDRRDRPSAPISCRSQSTRNAPLENSIQPGTRTVNYLHRFARERHNRQTARLIVSGLTRPSSGLEFLARPFQHKAAPRRNYFSRRKTGSARQQPRTHAIEAR
jgi:hypothetical protein